MPILYSLVARGTVVLAEFSAAAGNASSIARRILEKFPEGGDTRASYSQERHIFHILRLGGIIYLCMVNDAFGRRIPFAFLEEISTRFSKTYGRVAQTALAYAMNDEFSRVLSQQMEYFSSNPNADTINRVRGEIAEVKSVMVENIDKVLERGEKIELLVDKTDALQGDAFRFKKQSRRLKQAMWLKNAKLTAVLTGVILLVLYIFVSLVCGGLALSGCR
jgi:vesicle-associated membrane protein 7